MFISTYSKTEIGYFQCSFVLGKIKIDLWWIHFKCHIVMNSGDSDDMCCLDWIESFFGNCNAKGRFRLEGLVQLEDIDSKGLILLQGAGKTDELWGFQSKRSKRTSKNPSQI